MAVLVGVISDTHGLLRKEAVQVLAGCSLIVHAGDAGSPEVLDCLRSIAPVKAVRGNVDGGAWAQRLHVTETIEVEHAKLFVVHEISMLHFNPAVRGYHAVISGHSHRAEIETKNGVLYLNPGSAGPRRFKLPVTLAVLVVEGASVSARVVTLPV